MLKKFSWQYFSHTITWKVKRALSLNERSAMCSGVHRVKETQFLLRAQTLVFDLLRDLEKPRILCSLLSAESCTRVRRKREKSEELYERIQVNRYFDRSLIFLLQQRLIIMMREFPTRVRDAKEPDLLIYLLRTFSVVYLRLVDHLISIKLLNFYAKNFFFFGVFLNSRLKYHTAH